ncbi:MAG: 5'-nucleotidase C-terminal domain-containing protein [Pseudomonadota bacterium]
MNSPHAFADLRILATSDVHMHLTSWDPLHQRHVAGRGFDVLARKLQSARNAAAGACILLDNGDAVQGTPVGAHCATLPSETPHPWPEILNVLRYDAVGLGNHDFDFGLPFLERIVQQTHAPTLCASVSSGQIEGVEPSTLLTRTLTCSDGETRPVRIGVTSVLPPQTAIWNHRYLTGLLEFDAGTPAARRAVQSLQARGADIVVLLCHSGLSPIESGDEENFGHQLAQDVEGIDAIVLGHTHELFPGPDGQSALNGVPAVMPGYGAEALGQIDLSLRWTENGWHVAGHDVALLAPDQEDDPAPFISALTAPVIAQMQDALDRTLTHSNSGFHSFFGMLMSGASDALVARAMTDVIAEHVAGTELAELPLLASVAPVSMGGRAGPGNYVDIPAGPVQTRHIAMLTPFHNAVWAVVLTGADLVHWVERAAVFFAPSVNENGRLVDAETPSFNFDMLYGLKAEIDPFRPPMFNTLGQVIDPSARRVRQLNFEDSPVDPEAEFLVAMSSFRGAGGGNFPGISESTQVVRTNQDLTEAVQRTAERGALSPDHCASVWRFASDRSARVSIETSPRAGAHLDEISGFEPEVIGENDAGFLEVSVLI